MIKRQFQRQFQRKQYIIKPKFQLKISAIIMGTLLTAVIITISFLYINIMNSIILEFSSKELKEKINLAVELRQHQLQYTKQMGDKKLFDVLFPKEADILADYEKDIIINVLHKVNKNLIPWILILLSLTLVAGIFLTHRIAGPIYNIEKSLDEIRKGDLAKRIYLRWSDEFKNLANLANEFVAKLDKSTSECKELVTKLKQLNEQLKSSITDKETIKLVNEVENNINTLKDLLDQYKTTG